MNCIVSYSDIGCEDVNWISGLEFSPELGFGSGGTFKTPELFDY